MATPEVRRSITGQETQSRGKGDNDAPIKFKIAYIYPWMPRSPFERLYLQDCQRKGEEPFSTPEEQNNHRRRWDAQRKQQELVYTRRQAMGLVSGITGLAKGRRSKADRAYGL